MKQSRILIAFSALSLALSLATLPFLPDSLPLRWNAAGVVVARGGKANLLWMAALPLAMSLLFRVLPRIDPLADAYRRHEKSYAAIERLLVPALALLGWITVAAALGLPLEAGSLVRVLVGLLLVGVGNFLGRLKRNWFLGIKTPWALADDEVWRLTHRRGALVFVAMGFAYVLSLLVPPGPFLETLMVALTLGGAAYVFLYSWLVWRRLRGPAARLPRGGGRNEPGAAGEKPVDGEEVPE